jgi:cell wall-associated NlpC family hydrolase
VPAPPGTPAEGDAVAMNRLRRCATTMLLAFAATGGAAVPVLAEPGEIDAKRAEAQRVLAEIDNLDVSLGQAVEAYDAATSKLGGIEHEQQVNRNALRIARANLRHQQAALARRLVAIYTSESDDSTLSVLLGATSLTDFVDRVDTVHRVADQDAQLMRQVRAFKATIVRQKRELASAHARQAALVQERADAKASIEAQLAERRELVASIRNEIARLQAQERARQLALERQARARLAALHVQQETAMSRAADASAEAASSDTIGVVAALPEATVVPSSRYGGVVGIAMQYLGVPYVWGGASPSGFDCSGLIVYVFAQVGVSLPHYTGALWNVGAPVSGDQLEAGDLVFFNGLGHAGIYIGGGQFIHAPHTGDVVKISSMFEGWYASSYMGARRIL